MQSHEGKTPVQGPIPVHVRRSEPTGIFWGKKFSTSYKAFLSADMRTIYVSELLQYDFEEEPPLQVPMDTFLFIYLEMFLMCPWESVHLKWRTDTGTFSTSLMSTQINNNNFFQLHVPHSISVMLPTLQCNSIRGRWTLINGKSSFHYTKIKVYRLGCERFQAFSIKNSCYHPQKLTFSCGLTIFNESSLNLQFIKGIIRE